MTAVALTSSKSNEHYTPPLVIDPSRELMRSIRLDPCSCANANVLVQAERFYDEAQDGLKQRWVAETVLLNPRGGVIGGRSALALFWEKLEHHYLTGDIQQAVFVAFQLSILRTCPTVWRYCMCVPRDRLHFWIHGNDQSLIDRFKDRPDPIAAHATWIRRKLQQPEKFRPLIAGASHDNLPDQPERWGNWLFESDSPTHDNILIYLPPRDGLQREIQKVRFHQLFSPIGHCEVK